MSRLVRTPEFKKWFSKLRDRRAKLKIAERIARIASGHLGDVKSVGGGVSEARLHIGKGYRLYFIKRGGELVIMLAGGDKSSQERDIKRARELAEEWRRL